MQSLAVVHVEHASTLAASVGFWQKATAVELLASHCTSSSWYRVLLQAPDLFPPPLRSVLILEAEPHTMGEAKGGQYGGVRKPQSVFNVGVGFFSFLILLFS